MALSILAWNMQGERSINVRDSYRLMFTTVLGSLFRRSPADVWIVYLCEAGNPWGITLPPGLVPGSAGAMFNSYAPGGAVWDLAWTLPRGLAVQGFYVPWQNGGGGANLRCSVMMMEVADKSAGPPAFTGAWGFFPSNTPGLNNLRPALYVNLPVLGGMAHVTGVHNTATPATALGETNALAAAFAAVGDPTCVVGDLNVDLPRPLGAPLPPGLVLGPYAVLASGESTQASGGQLDWAFQNMNPAATAQASDSVAGVPARIQERMTGRNSSDHEILYYRIP